MGALRNSTQKEARKEERDKRVFGVLFNKQLGQHILKNPLVVQNIIDRVSSDYYWGRLPEQHAYLSVFTSLRFVLQTQYLKLVLVRVI
jgi:hypothetical protein